MKMNLAVPYGRVNRDNVLITKEAVLKALYKKGYTDANISVDEGTQTVYVLIEIIDTGKDSIVVFKADNEESDDLFPLAPL